MTGEKFRLARTDQEVEARFHTYLAKWRDQTQLESNYNRILANPNFRRILALGPQAVPLILADMQQGSGGAWFQALEDITGENPIPPEHEIDTNLMIADWLDWGRRNGII